MIFLPEEYENGLIDFAGCKIDLSLRPLIPRPETEHWTLKAIEDIKKTHKPTRCLDIFAGSGCIGIALLKHLLSAQVDFAEKEEKFLKQIKLNAKINGINRERYRIFKSDIFSGIKDRYDFILANPPYVAESKINLVEESVLQYEPHEALFAGPDGMNIIRNFLPEAKNHLERGGKVYMECDPDQKKAINGIMVDLNCRDYKFFKDQYQKWRYIVIKF